MVQSVLAAIAWRVASVRTFMAIYLSAARVDGLAETGESSARAADLSEARIVGFAVISESSARAAETPELRQAFIPEQHTTDDRGLGEANAVQCSAVQCDAEQFDISISYVYWL